MACDGSGKIKGSGAAKVDGNGNVIGWERDNDCSGCNKCDPPAAQTPAATPPEQPKKWWKK